MKFLDYYKSLPTGGRRALAEAIGVAPSYLYQMGTARKPIPTRLWRKIEQETSGAVSVLDLLEEDTVIHGRAA